MKKGLHAFLMSKKLRLDGSAAKQPEIKAIHFISVFLWHYPKNIVSAEISDIFLR